MSNDDIALETIRERLAESAAIKETMRQDVDLVAVIAGIAEAVIEAYRTGKKVLLFGNGGSAADAQHIAAELVGRFFVNRDPLAAISLTTNTSSLTAVGNDFSFDEIFVRQIECLGHRGDVAIGFSTSGNSENVIRALEIAGSRGLVTVAFTGSSGGKLRDTVDYCLQAPSENTARIQEAHITAAHIMCELVERAMFGNRT